MAKPTRHDGDLDPGDSPPPSAATAALIRLFDQIAANERGRTESDRARAEVDRVQAEARGRLGTMIESTNDDVQDIKATLKRVVQLMELSEQRAQRAEEAEEKAAAARWGAIGKWSDSKIVLILGTGGATLALKWLAAKLGIGDSP